MQIKKKKKSVKIMAKTTSGSVARRFAIKIAVKKYVRFLITSNFAINLKDVFYSVDLKNKNYLDG